MLDAESPPPPASLSPAQRPRLRLREHALVHGPERLADVDLLALLIGTGSEGESARSVAARVLDESGDLAGIRKLGRRGLSERRGIGPAKAARILAALELGHRAAEYLLEEDRIVLSSFDAVVRWARPRLAPLEHEEVWLLSLDGRNALRCAHRIAKGGLHGCALTPRDVLRPALRDGASAIILLHNHPSGDPSPSTEDVQMTRALCIACEVVGLTLLDHVVIAKSGAESVRELALETPTS